MKKRRVSRKQFGVGIMMLITGLSLVILPMIGVLVIEMNRFQFTRQAISKACDAAALAGGAKLISAETDASNPDAVQRRTQKQLQARAAAIDFMRRQTILGVDLGPNLDVAGVGETIGDINGIQPNKARIAVYPADPAANYAKVDFGDAKGRAIKVEAAFMEVPSFLVNLGVTRVPVLSSSTSGMPRIEIVLCMDMSGSMDDCTRVTLVRKLFNLTDQGRSDYNNLPPPPSPPDIDQECGAKPDPCDPNEQSCKDYLDCVDSKCNQYGQQFASWMAQFDAATGPAKRFIDYQIVADGQLRRIFSQPPNVIPPAGTQINALPHRHLSFTSQPWVDKDFPYKWQGQGTITNCGGGKGFTDIVVNLDDRIKQGKPDPEQPILDNYPFGGVNGASKAGNQYRNLAELVECSRGAAPNGTAAEIWPAPYTAASQAKWGQILIGGQPIRENYEKDSLPYLQPAATVIDAAKSFVDSLADSGRSIKMGVIGYEKDVPTLPPPDDPVTPAFENQSQVTVVSDAANESDRYVPLVGLIGLDQDGASNLLKDKIDTMYSLRQTDIAGALGRAKEVLTQNQTPSRSVKKLIVLFTDGQFTGDSPVPVAQSCKDAGIAIYSVGLAQNQAVQQIMDQTLSDSSPGGISYEAGNGGIYLSSPSAKEVRKTFLLLARRLAKLQQ